MSRVIPAVRPPAVLYDIDWRIYTRLLRAFEGHRRVRLTYDRGILEIMAPLYAHEGPAYLLARFIDVLSEELNLPMRGGGSVTLRRRRHRRGLEPDKCFWIASVSKLQGKMRLDLRIDPPPDLAIEVDVTNSSLNRMSIYATLGIPEVWRVSEDEGLTFNGLDGKQYQVRTHSLAFRALTPADLLPFLALQGQTDDTSIARRFREWVRLHLLAGAEPGS